MMDFILIVILIVLISISAAFSATEAALFSLSSMQVKALEGSTNSRSKMVAELLSQPRKLLVTILMINVFTNILVQNVVSAIFGTFSLWVFTVGVPLVLVLIFGEILPKTIALGSNMWIAHTMAPFVLFVEKIVRPLRDGIVAFTTPISSICFFFLKKEEEISVDELRHALRASKEHGVLHEEESILVRGYLNLQELSVKEVMCPRTEMQFYDVSDPMTSLIHLFVDLEFTRVPICNGSCDHMLGIITAQDFFLHRGEIGSLETLLRFATPPVYVPETMPAKNAMHQLYAEQNDVMIVVDEYGSVSGLVTLEDCIEVVVGSIEDRRDEKRRFTRAGEDVIICSGKLELAELEEIFDVHLESRANMVTVGGWIIEQLGDIPTTGAKLITKEFLFQVLSADPNRIRRVYIKFMHPQKRGSK